MEAKPVRVEVGLEGVPAPVCGLVEELEAAGYESYVVGGGVRDLLLRRTPGDFDVATAAPVEALLEIFPRAIPIGLRHGTLMVPTVSGPVDVTRFRHGESLEGDLAHRDFTINAIAWHPTRAELVDPHDGQGDLTKGRLRAVGSADERFAEDPLRALRGVRLAAQLGLDVAPELVEAMQRAAPELARVARERIRHELTTLLLAEDVTSGLTLLRRSGIEASLAPGVRGDAAVVVGALPRDVELRLAGWLRGTRSTKLLRDLRFPRRTNQGVEHLLRWHPIEANVDPSRDANVRRHMKRVGPERVEALLALRHAELEAGDSADAELARANLAALEAGLARVAAAGRATLQRHDLVIDGREVMELLGLGPGPHVGRALAFLTDRVLEDPSQNSRETLRRLVTSFAADIEKGDESA